MSGAGVSTAYAVSPDSGQHWMAEGAWPVAEGIYRIPLPLPMDGLKAVNVYVIQGDDGLTLIDGGWAIPQARELLERCLGSIDSGFGDIKRFLVTHAHRDHYTLASILGAELGVDVALGIGEQPALELLDKLDEIETNPFYDVLVSAGARDVGEAWLAGSAHTDKPDPAMWTMPDTWIDGDQQIALGARTLDAVHTPGHTPGHFCFADLPAGLLFAGDHVLPTITPSIGFTMPVAEQPLGDFMGSLSKVMTLPDLRLLPAHGPLAPSSHTRCAELLVHHDDRLALCLSALAGGDRTARQVAEQLPWTRHERTYESLDFFNRGLAAMETKAHLDLLVARETVSVIDGSDGYVYTLVR